MPAKRAAATAPRKSAPRKKSTGTGPVSRAEFNALAAQVKELYTAYQASSAAKQRALAKKMAQDPERLAQLKELVAQAEAESNPAQTG